MPELVLDVVSAAAGHVDIDIDMLYREVSDSNSAFKDIGAESGSDEKFII